MADHRHKLLVVMGSTVMILGALAISTAVASAKEQTSTNEAVLRECERYGLDYNRTIASMGGDEFGDRNERRRWWDYAILAVATGVFVWLGVRAVVPPLAMGGRWIAVLVAGVLLSLAAGTWALERRRRLS